VAFLQGLSNDVKVALLAIVLIAFLAGLLYLQFRFTRRRG
jgi:hypothetical protein